MNPIIEDLREGHNISDKQLDDLYQFFTEYHQHYFPDDDLLDRERYRISLSSNQEYQHVLRFLGRHHLTEEIIGYAWMIIQTKASPEYNTNGSLSRISIRVLPEFENQGVGSALLHNIIQCATRTGITKLEYLAFSESAIHLSQKYQAVPGPIGGERRVKLVDIDKEMIANWINTGKSTNPNYSILFTDFIMDTHIEDYLSVYNATMNDAPSDGIESVSVETVETRRSMENELRETNYIPFICYVKDPKGKIVGLTEMIYDPSNPKIIYQELTGVLPEARGKGIGKMIKALMIDKISQELDKLEIISTGTADSNAAMTSINRRIGFKEFRNNQFFTLSVDEYNKIHQF